MRVLAPMLLAAFALACGTVGPSPLTAGVWGGDHIAMTITESSVHLELDCAHGDVPNPITIDSRGQFAIAGTFVREHGGPIRIDEPADSHPAMYTGSVSSNAMTLTIQQTDTNQMIGKFDLVRGTQGRVVKCL